ncbi:MAG TPA: cytochrome c peroxidase [Myxococcota bacterium]|nr:cytochrome c peroxidase [Myxococcota bacterium]
MQRIPLFGLGIATVMVLSLEPVVLAEGQFLTNGLLPSVPVPVDNPQTDAKIRLGKQLYFDTRLSADNTISCATCHIPKTGWANNSPTDTGIKGQVGGRNSGSIINSAYMRVQFWDGRAASLEEQALGPIHNPIEMGETLENVISKLNAIPGYLEQFRTVFGTDVTTEGIGKAIASFERTIIAGPSPYDLYLQGQKDALSPAALRGLRIFNGKGHCSPCHSGPSFSDQSYHNLGVGMDKANPDLGREAVSKDPKDRGRFKTPTLRNTAQTPPYLHDGSEASLRDVVELYNRGGVPNPSLDALVFPLHLTESEKADLVVFMEALTGPVPEVAVPDLPKNAGENGGGQ